ncbi:hypothetical protein ACVWZM_002684 [Bradyrhizobium sp. USDA 4501]
MTAQEPEMFDAIFRLGSTLMRDYSVRFGKTLPRYERVALERMYDAATRVAGKLS